MNFWPRTCQENLRALKRVALLNPETLPESTDPDFEFDYVDIGNVSLEGGIVARERMRFADSPSRARKPVRNGDVIISTVRTYLRAVASIDKGADGCIASTGFAVIRPYKNADYRFLFRVIQSNPFVENVVAESNGVSYPAINPSRLENLLVPLPDLENQRHIADFLDRETARIDQLIEKKNRFVDIIDEKRSALITAAVTGLFDTLTGHTRKSAEYSASVSVWFSKLPLGWVSRRVKTISPVMRGASPRPIDDPVYFDDDGEFAWVRISDVTSSRGRLTQTTQRLSSLGATKSVKLDPGKLFLSIAGTVGKPCITDIKACIHDGFVYFPYLPQESQKYLYWIFESRECFSGLGKLGTQLNLNTETVGNISIPFPPLETQKAIAGFLDQETTRFDELKSKTYESMMSLREYRSALITAAVTGQIDVGTWSRRGSTDRRLDQIEEEMSA